MRELLNEYKKSQYKMEIVTAGLLAICTMMLLCYKDAVCLAVWSTNIWDCLFEGRIFEYYQYCIQNIHELPLLSPGSNFLPFLPTAIWCLPIWAVQYFFGVDIKSSVICMMWYRLFYIVLLVLLIVYVRKICKLLHYEQQQISLISLLCGTCVFVQISISYAGQSDLEWILPGVMAFYFLLKEDWSKFYVFVNISMFFKPYFFPVAFLMILYCEKDVLKIILKTVLSVIGSLGVSFVCGFFPGYSDATTANDVVLSMFAEYLNNAILFPYGWASLLVIFVVIMCAVSYLSNIKDGEKEPQTMLSIVAIFYCSWFLFAGENFYRMIMIVPWVFMVLFKDGEKNELILWLLTLYSYVLILVYRFHETTHYFNIKSGMYASVISNSIIEKTPDFFDILSVKLGSTFNHMGYMINGVWVGLTIIVVLFMIPSFYNKYIFPGKVINRRWVQRTLIWLNIVAVVPLVLSALISFWA